MSMKLKRNLFLFVALYTSLFIGAQTYNFESASLPNGWSTGSSGELSITNEHFKEGIRSLKWETNAKTILNISLPAQYTASNGNSAFLQIYSPEVSNDTLVFEFLNNNNVRRTANYLLNYKGWREFNRAYNEYASNTSFSVTAVRITIKPSSQGSRFICFDDVRLNQSTTKDRIMGSQWVLDKNFFSSNNEQLELYANPKDIALTTPTQAEIDALYALRAKLSRTPTSSSTVILNQTKNYVNGLNIIRNTDGSVKGQVMNMSVASLTTAVVTDYVNKLEVLAADALKNESTIALFRNFLDHLLDQGFAEGVSFIIKTNDYTPARNIPSKLLNILPVCTEAQKVELIKLVAWLSYYGKIYDSEDSFLGKLNSDVVYLFLPHMLATALYQTDDAVAVRDLKAVKRYMERNSAYTPGGNDILKPDGTGFHHGTHYNNYMYSYQTWVEYINHLRATPFKISADAYERIKKAVVSEYIMATLDSNNSRHYANTLAGRNAFASGLNVFFTRALFEELILTGGDIYGTDIDEDLAAAYNYFFKSNKYNVEAKNFEGFYQFNYSPLAIFRKHDWVATMRAPTTNRWTAEIYSGKNRFGRYQGHGSLEITYGNTLAHSGYPGNNTGAGWDWNVVPGTTTVHYNSWQEMMPGKNTTDRFDQYTKTKDFSGALEWGSSGIFATDFDQGDNWGNQRFTPTNLVFKKSVFAFDNILISLGTNISSSGTYDNSMITATNLFQNLTSSVSGSLILNGNEISFPHSTLINSNQDNWIISPQGTGYYIPQGNDEINLIYDTQKSPSETGADYSAPNTTVNAAKAYINHGVKPNDKKYSFVVVPATNSEEMQTLTAQMADNGGSIYSINSQDDKLHSVSYLPDGITAYVFFDAVSNIDFGIVKSSSAEHLLSHKATSSGNQYFAATNPNLKPVADAVFGWRSSPSQATIILAGEWYPLYENPSIECFPPSDGETKITLTFTDGEPLYFVLNETGETSVKNIKLNHQVKFSHDKNFIFIQSDINFSEQFDVKIYNLAGVSIYNQAYDSFNDKAQIPISSLESGMYLCQVNFHNEQSAIFKFRI